MRLFSLIVFISLVVSVWGSRAFPIQKIVSQPNGERLTICLMGDEYFHSYSTLDDVLVCQDTNNVWCYASLKNYKLASTGIQAKEKALRNYFEQQQVEELKFETDVQLRNLQLFMQNKAAAEQNDAPLKAIGTPNIPVILVQYQDVKFTDECTPVFFEKHFNGVNYKDEGGWGSVRDYFIAQSDSLFMPSFKILGVVTLPNKMSYYGQNWGGNDKNDVLMEKQAIDSILSWGTSMDEFLVDKTIPLTAFIYAGYGEQASSESNAVWAKCYPSLGYNLGGYTFMGTVCTNEIADYTGMGDKPDGIGTFVHEFGHGLGLPDFYATNGLSNNFGLDYWDIMDWGQYCEYSQRPVGYSAYERMFMGWLQPTVLSTTNPQNLLLTPLSGREGVRSVMIPNSANANEYLLLENRVESTWFSSYYGEGMLIYHVDYNAYAWSTNTLNNTRSHQRMSIIPADNTLTPYYTYSGGKRIFAKQSDYQGDLYPGLTNNKELSDTSTPADIAFYDGYFHRSLSKITKLNNKNIYFEYMSDGSSIGDINNDKSVNATDLTLLISMIMSSYSSLDDAFIRADVNNDGVLNASDITLLINLIMDAGNNIE